MKLAIDEERYEVTRGKKQVELSPKEYLILQALVKADGRVLSRENLIKMIWKRDSSIDRPSVDQHVSRLRKRIGADAIITMTRFGYKINRMVLS